ncbi:MAG: tRNA (guanosine(37)-N1)-methyltransferase TrmD [Bdellovibrionales bacterium]|nr:tRNA (guanosine(37)-N1)-methyltransferase TrmD [Bdellovibrionales bacterium]
MKKASDNALLSVNCTNIREFASPPHYHVDDTPYGGGAGMVFKPEPLAKAIESAKLKLPDAQVVLMTPSGERLCQKLAVEFSSASELILVCGRYEGIDQRVIELLIDREISIGDYILMGGELPAMVLLEAITRLIPGVLGNQESTCTESFSVSDGHQLLEAPHFTKPAIFRGIAVPEVLTSGNHKEIEKWRHDQSLAKTKRIRPDLMGGNK